MVVYLAYGNTANFRFRGSIAKINISKERQDYGDRSGPRILEIGSVIQKLSRFPQVQSEREWTLGHAVEYGLIFHGTRTGKYYCKNMKYRINIYIYSILHILTIVFPIRVT